MQGSTYNPTNVADFEKSKLVFNGQKATAICDPGGVAHADLTVSDDYLLTGSSIVFVNALPKDNVKFQILSADKSTILNQFIDWYAKDFDKVLPYPAKIYAGLTIRIEYTSFGTQPVEIYVNHDLHKVMI